MSEIFTPYKLGPIELRNRTIRSAAFEGMGRNNGPTEELFNYHRAVAKGGIGMTTVAYAAVCRSGISFDSQLWMREEIVPELKRLTDAVHAEGAKASIQLGHCGNMTHRRTCGQMPIGASSGFNLYSPTFHRKMNQKDIDEVVKAYGDAVRLAMKAGFDAVEIHAGHGYLISQFLSPYTNHRHDRYGGSLDKRMNFMRECIREVVKAADGKIAVTAKLNTRDGFKGGQEVDELIEVAKELRRLGVDAITLSGGFVSRAPQYVMRGEFPTKAIAHYLPASQWWLKICLYIGSWAVCPTVTFKHLFFMEDALKFKAAMPDYPFIYVGGVTTGEDARKVLENGFPLFQMGRAVLEDTDFVNKLKADENHCSGCEHSNFCIGRMYSKSMQCHKHCEDITPFLEREVQRINRRNDRRERKAGYKA
ncbi:MAG: NADH:flavin oxidoreductase [Bacteroidales bacterium]|nr:NADH:flavin oxidoreductase [Rikenellaceae bacterium]MDD6975481.1 NADH:flavin oxidoreductase [Bacteroidales bacterium]MDY6170115.1 NADH:flavin oxidoreductase [Candidatus Cryptobacteroides sp.]